MHGDAVNAVANVGIRVGKLILRVQSAIDRQPRLAAVVGTESAGGVYFGTTGGQVYASADGGDHWVPIVRDLPAVLSVEVQTLQ